MIRFIAFPLLLAALLGSVHVLPERGNVAESAIRMDLPLEIGAWQGVRIPESKLERDILAKDTEFAKAEYRRARSSWLLGGDSGDFDRVSVSIVLSGYDINNSIHRPERCLPAQGHVIFGKSGRGIELPNGRRLPVTRLESRQALRLREDSDEVVMVDSLIYYFFVGANRVTNDHYERTFIDMKDRLLSGSDQRWAYVTVATATGDMPWFGRTIDPAEADQILAGFCAELATIAIDWSAVAD